MSSHESNGQTQWVFSFESGNSGMRDLLGGKGAELWPR